ncbi:hypothetical protein B0F90DRAFT_1716446, partial [Multifurca ochricompacta]
GGSNYRPSDISSKLDIDHESDTNSDGSPQTASSSSSSAFPSLYSDSSVQQEQQQQKGHYRGITFEEILPSHLITNAPPSTVEQKRGSFRHPKPAEQSLTTSPTGGPPPPIKQRSYPSSRIRDTARALVRGLSIAKRDSRGHDRDGYKVV